MKRLILTVTGTVGALAALLSFKTQSPISDAAALPAASIDSPTSPSSAAASSSSSSSTTAAGAPTPGNASSSTSKASSTTSNSTSQSATKSASKSASSAPARTYLGSAITTQYGVIQVEVTVKNRKITKVSFAQLTAFDGRSQQINSDAAPQLLQETLSAQSANIDTVSGASYTSDGYRRSLQSALDKAGI